MAIQDFKRGVGKKSAPNCQGTPYKYTCQEMVNMYKLKKALLLHAG